ncbi:hypothetical protein HMPREF0576_0041 [Mobiluncus holmesii ATCC 35242]|uniref:Uncharacterized protein n=1 Tax=Mobiluncus holmesii ATCC 35242 TaxID=887899 RepID=E6M1G6_9ACTO|nr:hypothetical protein HMPREF0576_0041 [Mobiluncus holmesii ATCC 35242]
MEPGASTDIDVLYLSYHTCDTLSPVLTKKTFNLPFNLTNLLVATRINLSLP